MTDDQTLLDLAGRATPGPWSDERLSDRDSYEVCAHDGSDWEILICETRKRDARFITAANPERITRLISEKRSEAARADLTGFMLAWVVAVAGRGMSAQAKPYVFHSLSACAGCGCSGDDFGSVNVEAFEMTGELYCDDCADEAIENASQGDDE